ncbi:MAG: hypothetical protein GY713_17990, partial [Actinomycetia bacterium]|nr:hypothetical protein [Actinomycetes bacterium]
DHRQRYVHDPADPQSLSDDRVTALLHDREGTLWIGTLGGGLNRLVENRSGETRLAEGSGRVEGSGLFERYRHQPGRAESLSADAVTVIFEDHRGRLWIGTHGGGLNLYQGGDTFTRFRHQPADRTSLSNDRVLSLAEDRDGFLWLTTDGGGLNRLHPATGAFLRLTHDPAVPDSLSSNEPNVVHVDAAGRLWVGTEGAGVDLLEALDEATGRARFRHVARAEGLPDDTIWGIRSDAAGDLWLSTGNGLARLDPETWTVKTYSTSHGLQSDEFMMGAHFASPSGELFFGGVNGLNAFFPDRIVSNQHLPTVVVTAFTKLNRPVLFGRPVFDVEEITLGYRDYYFSVELAALDFTAMEQHRRRVLLPDIDPD